MELQKLINRQRAWFSSGVTLDVDTRIEFLQQLYASIQRHEGTICTALKTDLGKSESESFLCEIGMTLRELSHILKHLRRWTRPTPHKTGLAHFPSKGFTLHEPYGVVLVMSPWNYPFLLTMAPLIGAIAAGNCCIVKPSAYSPATAAVVETILRDVFPLEYVAVVQGGRQENAQLLEQHFDYIFFTGGTAVGKLVMEKASAHLTPVSLELGGKSPCIVDATADLKLAARRIAFGKWINCGQTCVAPDYVLIDRRVKDKFLAHLKQEIPKMYGDDILANPDYGKIINDKHFRRLLNLMDSGDLIFGGRSDEMQLRIEPTVLDNVSPNSPVMQEEIFGPILPILTYDSVEQAEQFIKEREKPLALYLFTRSKAAEQRFLRHVSFGGGCINDTMIHLANSELPFGGVGSSGMGSYHGVKSFETFSHEKSIVKKYPWPDLPLRYQPYKPLNLKIARLFLK